MITLLCKWVFGNTDNVTSSITRITFPNSGFIRITNGIATDCFFGDIIIIRFARRRINQQILKLTQRRFLLPLSRCSPISICSNIISRNLNTFQQCSIFRTHALFIPIQIIRNGRIFIFFIFQQLPPIPGFHHLNGSPVPIFEKNIGQCSIVKVLGIQTVRNRIWKNFPDRVIPPPPLSVKFGKRITFRTERICCRVGVIFNIITQLCLGNYLNSSVIFPLLKFCISIFLIQRIDIRIQRTIQFNSNCWIILLFNLIPFKSLPGLNATDSHIIRQSVCELVIWSGIRNVQVFTSLTLYLKVVLRCLHISSVNGHTVIIQSLLETVDILPSLIVIQGQVAHLSPPVVGIIHGPDRILAVGVLPKRTKFVYRFIWIGLRIAF